MQESEHTDGPWTKAHIVKSAKPEHTHTPRARQVQDAHIVESASLLEVYSGKQKSRVHSQANVSIWFMRCSDDVEHPSARLQSQNVKKFAVKKVLNVLANIQVDLHIISIGLRKMLQHFFWPRCSQSFPGIAVIPRELPDFSLF